ncbi:hypothetical protein B0G80_5299 [Paraburkholderia sp. BL6669N2]|uniref:DUF6471 domain-containing protein n=1 Tax=Paraburkholderia sp. BL6669N2 TaxID=1938807 RepID=UPI000E231BFB|nr:hypothetical protein B0G80_5299 [Paraburkholderia sp. BL6669N2]
MEGNDKEWAALASRAIRGLLVRKGVSVPRLASEFARHGASESARALEGRMHRGTFRFGFFLQVVATIHADYPPHWRQAMTSAGNWDARASHLFQAELAARPWLNWVEIGRRLASISENWDPDALSAAVSAGDFAATLFLQCSVVCSFQGIELFVDQSDLCEAARKGAASLVEIPRPKSDRA